MNNPIKILKTTVGALFLATCLVGISKLCFDEIITILGILLILCFCFLLGILVEAALEMWK